MDRYVVIGNPVAHSLSPVIHARFAASTGQVMEYARLLVPLDAFETQVRAFFEAGGRGANVTLPFKREAFAFAARASERASLAGAANFLVCRGTAVEADNTDGAGLVRDLAANLGPKLEGARVLLVGAGGAARGVVAPLLGAGIASLAIANRTLANAEALATRFAPLGNVEALALDADTGPFDVVINATSTSTQGEALELPRGAIAPGTFAYDMAYGDAARPFLQRARDRGAAASDGLGMLVEQAAESFFLWRGVRPDTRTVLAELRERHPS